MPVPSKALSPTISQPGLFVGWLAFEPVGHSRGGRSRTTGAGRSISTATRAARRSLAPAAASAPVEMPRQARALQALVQQGGAASAAEQLARVERFGELLVDSDRQRIHADDLLRPRADARMSEPTVSPDRWPPIMTGIGYRVAQQGERALARHLEGTRLGPDDVGDDHLAAIGPLRGGRRSRRPTRPQPRPPVLPAGREQSCCDRRLSVERRKTFPAFRRT